MLAVSVVPGSPQAPNYRRFRSGAGEHLLVVPHTRIFDLSHALAASLDVDVQAADRFAAALGETSELEADLAAVVTPAPQSLSLNVSSSCNLSCGYCYADRGAFGGAQAATMQTVVAEQAVERLLAVADPARPITIGFLGGEPLRNRDLVHAIVH
ncbi:MAG: 4Fe-4S cluster-binding domain-containing protein, partial [Hyphomicrobiales bacterium]|nr:4Fe-4S cluster-binding domain-containing protein [Hyphomicrobiales bacterium]